MMFATRYCIFFRKRRSIKIHHQQQNHYPFQPYAFMHRRRDENASQPSRNAFDIILNVKSLLVPSHDSSSAHSQSTMHDAQLWRSFDGKRIPCCFLSKSR
jgi:hypothetical protein